MKIEKNKKKFRWFDEIFTYDTVTSTNDVALELLRQYPKGRFAVIALKQTNGRGRIGKSWISPKKNLYISIAIHTKKFEEISLLPVKFSLWLVDVLEEIGLSCSIKWPNDILMESSKSLPYFGSYKKLAGILTETNTYSNKEFLTIVGIGINLQKNKNITRLIPHAGFIDEYIKISYKKFLNKIILKFDDELSKKHNKKNIISLYKAKCATIGKKVIVDHDPDVVYEATTIDSCGSLVLKSSKKKLKINYGEVNFATHQNH